MQKLPLRPLRLIRLQSIDVKSDGEMAEKSKGIRVENAEETGNNKIGTASISEKSVRMQSDIKERELTQEQTAANNLLRRTPNNYLFNQVYGLWFYISSFLLTVFITRSVPPAQYGVYAVVLTAYNTILYSVALGLEDATTTFIPRILAEHGEAGAAKLTRYLLEIRVLVLLLGTGLILFGLPGLAALIASLPIPGSTQFARGLADPILLSYSTPLAVYVLGTGITNLLSALCTARMRVQIVLLIGGLLQLGLLSAGFFLLQAGWGVYGVVWMQAIGSLISAVAFAIWQAPFLLKMGTDYRPPLKAIIQVGLSAWVTNIASGALLKQISITLLGIFAVSLTDIGYFNLSFQLADAANTLLISGFIGVGSSALAVAFVGNHYDRLANTWQVLIKVETLLAAPGLIFCLFNASNIADALYGSKFDPVGPLLAIFVFFNLLVRVLGATIHQASLYVIGKPRSVVISQWAGILCVILAGCVLIPIWGAAGALIADGIARTVTGIFLLFFLLRYLPSQYSKELLSFTLRFLLALVIAALPSILWHPNNRVLLGASGGLFILLCIGLLFWIKPLNASDMELLRQVNPRAAKYVHWFARKAYAKTT
jgi:O-antigen/teichoic acid export membrane protein